MDAWKLNSYQSFALEFITKAFQKWSVRFHTKINTVIVNPPVRRQESLFIWSMFNKERGGVI